MRKILLGLLLFPCAAFGEVSVTVYNQNLGVVREVRPFNLQEGVQLLKFRDVAAQIDPTSVALKGPAGFQVLEQNFDYDLISADAMLNKYIGQSLSGFDKAGKPYEGKLLSYDAGQLVLGTKAGGAQMLNRSELTRLEFPDIPGGLITRPTLSWQVKSPLSGSQDLALTYMTEGISWHAEYVALVSENEKKLDWSGWVSLDNQSGASYKNARLKLVAGDVNRAPVPRPMMKAMIAEGDMAGAPQFQEKSFFEYHLYTLQRPTDILDKQVKQVQLLAASNVGVKKIYTYEGSRDAKKVNVTLELENKEANGMGMPLPAGKVRVYKADTDKSDEFIGEDFIDHTPKDEKIRVKMGNAFDIVGERKVQSIRQAGGKANDQDIEITLRNHKQETVEIIVVERTWGEWRITKKSHPFRKKDATTFEFPVAVPADGSTTVSFTLHTGTVEGPQPSGE